MFPAGWTPDNNFKKMVPHAGTIRSMIMGLFAFLTRTAPKKPIVKVIRAPVFNRRAVKPDNTPLYLKRGWKTNRNKYQGYYRTIYGAWRGEIIRRGDVFNVFIFKPPLEQIKKHPRWPCFHRQRKDRWRIDLAKIPKDKDLSAIIFYVESIIFESFNK